MWGRARHQASRCDSLSKHQQASGVATSSSCSCSHPRPHSQTLTRNGSSIGQLPALCLGRYAPRSRRCAFCVVRLADLHHDAQPGTSSSSPARSTPCSASSPSPGGTRATTSRTPARSCRGASSSYVTPPEHRAAASLTSSLLQYKSLGIPQFNKAYAQRALLDENVQYLLLAFYWFMQVSIPLAGLDLVEARRGNWTVAGS